MLLTCNRTQEKKIMQLRAEKKLLATELKQHRARSSSIDSTASSSATLVVVSGAGGTTTPTPIEEEPPVPVVEVSPEPSPPTPPPPPSPPVKQRSNSGIEKDPRYLRLMTQLENCTERRQQLLAVLEENPNNQGAKGLLNDLETVLSMLRRKMRCLVEETQPTQPPAVS